MGSKKSQANSAQTTSNYDQRQVNTTTIDDRDIVSSYDLSQRNTSTSNSNNSTVLHYTGTDAGAAELLKGISQDQTDGIKTIAGFGEDALRRMGESATSMYATAGSNATKAFDLATERSTDAWTATVEKSTGLIDSLLKGASNTVNASRDIAQQAITSFQPTENKSADITKYALMAAAGVVVLWTLKKK